jgi:hypothetical protein
VAGFLMKTVKNNTQRSNKLSATLAVDGLEIIGLVEKNINRDYAASIKLNELKKSFHLVFF